MRSWGSQKFLNPVNSGDDGWFKFSIRKKKRSKGVLVDFDYDTYFTMADCSNKINLEFDPESEYTTTIYDNDPADRRKRRRDGLLKSIAARRAKVDTLAKGVLEFQKKLNEALDEFEDELRNMDLTDPETS